MKDILKKKMGVLGNGIYRDTLKFKLIFLIFFLHITISLYAQKAIESDTISLPFFSAQLSFQLPAADLADRFGYNSSVGGTFTYKTNKNWMWSFDANFIFGNKVKENDILLGIGTADSNIIGSNGQFIQVRLLERGYSLMGKTGKLFPVCSTNKNSGLAFMAGLGFLQHRINVESLGDFLPQLNPDYEKGYDRLSNGLALSQSLAYYYFSNKGKINFYISFELMEAFTKNRRGYNYDTQSYDTGNRIDILYGVRIGWCIPVNKKTPDKYYVD
jgi:hypothetical protein